MRGEVAQSWDERRWRKLRGEGDKETDGGEGEREIQGEREGETGGKRGRGRGTGRGNGRGRLKSKKDQGVSVSLLPPLSDAHASILTLKRC